MNAQSPLIADRFELRRLLGAGAFGTVFEAWDAQLGQRVAIKALHRLEPTALLRFKREFRAVKGVSHQNLVSLHELLQVGGDWFLVMEYVAGVDLAAWVWQTAEAATQAGARLLAWGDVHAGSTQVATAPTAPPLAPLPATPAGLSIDGSAAGHVSRQPRRLSAPGLERLRRVLPQLVDGVDALHRGGLLHRDLKPANVRVTPDGELRVLDCGLVTPLCEDGARSVAFAGTPHYMAPEQAAGGRVTPAADWYAVGVMLFELLTGVLPFDGEVGTVLTGKLHDEAPSPESLVPDLPGDLVATIRALLRREPSERPGGDALRALYAPAVTGDSAAAPGPGQRAEAARAEPRPASLLLGREAELARLHEAWRAAEAGRTSVALITGLSGVGKSSLCARFVESLSAAQAGLIALQGACYEGEHVPYKGLDSVVDQLASLLGRWPPERVAAVLPRDTPELVQVFPVLGRLSAVQQHRLGALRPTPEEVRALAFDALRELFARLAARHPLVLVVDDFQWADRDGVALMLELLRNPRPPPLLLVIALRREEIERTPPLTGFLEVLEAGDHLDRVRIDLDHLRAEVAREAARSYLARNPRWQELDEADRESRARSIARESGGNPFFIQELAQYEEEDVPNLGDALRRRIGRLPDLCRQVLELLAVAGQPLDRREVAAASSGGAFTTAIAALQVRRLIRVHADNQTLSPYHDRVRGAVRRSDIAGLAAHLLGRFVAAEAGGPTAFAPDAIERLVAHEWPGNVRELRNVVERSAIFAPGSVIRAEDILFAGGSTPGSADLALPEAVRAPGASLDMDETIRRQIVRALEAAGGNKKQAAKLLGIARSSLYLYLDRFNLR